MRQKIFSLHAAIIFISVLFLNNIDGQSTIINHCNEIWTEYELTAAFRKNLGSNKNFVAYDSLISSFIYKYEAKCPCSYDFAKMVWLLAFNRFHRLNNRDEALSLLSDKIKLCNGVNDSTSLYLHEKKAILHLRNDDFPNMKKHLDEAIAIGNKSFTPESDIVLNVMFNLGVYYAWKNDYDKALTIYDQNEAIMDNVSFKDTSLRVDNLVECASFSFLLNNLSNATHYINKIEKLTAGSRYEKPNRNRVIELYFTYYLKYGPLEKAKEYFYQIDTSAFNDYTRAILMIQYLSISDNKELALKNITKTERLMNNANVPPHQFLRINLALEKLRLGPEYFDNIDDLTLQVTTSIHNNYVNLINQGPHEQSTNISLITSKYVALISKLKSYDHNDLPSIVYDKMNNLKNASSSYYKELQNFINGSNDKTLKADFEKYKLLCKKVKDGLESDSLEYITSKIQNKIVRAGIKWHSNIGIKDIQKHLNAEDIFLDFYQTEKTNGIEQLYVFVTEKDRFHFHQFKNIQDSLATQWYATNYTNNSKKNKMLYDYLIQPLTKYLSGKNKIYISTDGMLNQVALDILRPNNKSKDLMGDIYNIIYVDNARSITQIKNDYANQPMPTFLLAGGIHYDCFMNGNNPHAAGNGSAEFQYLNGSKKEVEIISSRLNKMNVKYQSLTECAATKKSITEILNDKDVNHLHLSTHGYVENNGLKNIQNYYAYNSNAQILLAKEQENDDAELSAIEIINQNLSHKNLVFLAACNTGKGTYMSGFGNASIANAFKKAGAKKVIATLWPIPDEITVELCDQFYDHYLKSKDANAALKHAQKQMRAKYSSPEKWAAFRVMN